MSPLSTGVATPSLPPSRLSKCLESHDESSRRRNEAAPGINVSPSEENMRYFNVMVLGPVQLPYEVQVRFLTKIYHPNIDKALLSVPNPDDPLSDNIAEHWKANEAEAVETAYFS